MRRRLQQILAILDRRRGRAATCMQRGLATAVERLRERRIQAVRDIQRQQAKRTQQKALRRVAMAARRIQAAQRGREGRLLARSEKTQHEEVQQARRDAATCIQRRYQQHGARRRERAAVQIQQRARRRALGRRDS